MRVNEPITDREIELPDDEPLVSRTDRGGRIVFANHVFVEISGFAEHELVGAPHNVVRHPDMPPEAFADLWTTIQAGRPWDGLVKNRAKSGDFYWVQANVTPVIEDGALTGYISIRSKPTRAQIDIAETAYRRMRNGDSKGFVLADGDLVRRGKLAWLRNLARSVLGRFLVVTFVALLAIVLVGWLGFGGMAHSNRALDRLYHRDLVAVDELRTIIDRVRDNRNHLAQSIVALNRNATPAQVLEKREAPVRANLRQIDTLWQSYRGSGLTAEQGALADRFAAQYAELAHTVIEPALVLVGRGALDELQVLFEQHAPPLFQAVFDLNRGLVDLQIANGGETYAAAVAQFRRYLVIGVVIAAAGLVGVLVLGRSLMVTVRRCARELEQHFAAIIRGEMSAEIRRPPAREFWHLTAMLRAMRAHLAFASWESAEFGRKAAKIRRETVDRMAQTIEREAGAAVETVAQRTTAMANEAKAMAASAERVSANAQHVAGAADQAMKNAQVVAAASEELVAAIHEVSAQVEHASQVAGTAAVKGGEAQATIRSLSEAAGRIGAVVRLIADIAARTNLLALNATIEAARAGEAGRGFAVVAGEVKALATQTAKATEEISQQIGGLRGVTDAAVIAVEEIGHTLDEVAQVAISVAAAIEEQTAATQEIARNVTESGAAVQQVTARIAEVSSDAQQAGEQAGHLRVASSQVASDIAVLRGALVRTVRTATTEADRRLEARGRVEEPCTLTFGDAAATRRDGMLSDLSSGGAAVMPAGGPLKMANQGAGPGAKPGGDQGAVLGTVTLDRHGGVQSGFELRGVDPDGRLHIRFAGEAPAFARAVLAILSSGGAAAGGVAGASGTPAAGTAGNAAARTASAAGPPGGVGRRPRQAA
ncbi:MAG: methyl-accepting chemotaxis protein [Acetobacteraceae bacterium]